MAERKNRRDSENFVECDPEEVGFVLEPTKIEVGCGYTLCVKYDENEKPIIDVKTYGEVDVSKLRTEIARMFPDAQIRQLVQTPSVTIVKKCKGKRHTRKK
jgi:hypothetical protein